MSILVVTPQESTDFFAMLAQYQAGTLTGVTQAQIVAALQASNANWTGQIQAFEQNLDSIGYLVAVRQAKISYYKVGAYLGGTDDFIGISEANSTFYDGDQVIIWRKAGHILVVDAFNTTAYMAQDGNFLALVRVDGLWRVVGQSPASPHWPDSGEVTNLAILSSDTSITAFTPITAVTSATGGTPAFADYNITAATGTSGVISLYVDSILVAETSYTTATTIGAVGLALEASMAAGSNFTGVWTGGGVNILTITDALNLGSGGNAFILGDSVQGGVAGNIAANFSGGVDGTEATATLDTINGAFLGRGIKIINENVTEPILMTSGGNFDIGVNFRIQAGTWAEFLCSDGINWHVNAALIADARRTITATGNMLATDRVLLFDTTAGAITFTIDQSMIDQVVHVYFKKKGGGNTVTFAVSTGTITGTATLVTQGQLKTILGDGTNAYIV